MKKTVFALLLSLAALCGCQKNNSLEGQTFAAYAYHGNSMEIAGIHLDGYDAYRVIRFIDETKAEKCTRENSARGPLIGDIEYGTYVYSYPNVTITLVSSYSGKEYTIEGEFISPDVFRAGDLEYVKQ